MKAPGMLTLGLFVVLSAGNVLSRDVQAGFSRLPDFPHKTTHQGPNLFLRLFFSWF